MPWLQECVHDLAACPRAVAYMTRPSDLMTSPRLDREKKVGAIFPNVAGLK